MTTLLKSCSYGACACSQNCNATANANVVTLTGDYGSTASVQALGPMHFTRAFCNSVVLPDGTVLVMGGQVAAVCQPMCNSNGLGSGLGLG